MTDFITVPIVVGMIIYGIYSLFELFARRKERMALIEKMGSTGANIEFSNKFTGLKWAGLLLGVGLGLLVGFLIGNDFVPYKEFISISADDWRMLNTRHELLDIVYGASCLLGGGLGLLTAFLLEYKLAKNKEK